MKVIISVLTGLLLSYLVRLFFSAKGIELALWQHLLIGVVLIAVIGLVLYLIQKVTKKAPEQIQ